MLLLNIKTDTTGVSEKQANCNLVLDGQSANHSQH